MIAVIHESPADYEAEYLAIRARLIQQGSSLSQWCRENSVTRQLAVGALRGKSFGPKSLEIRRRLLREVLAS